MTGAATMAVIASGGAGGSGSGSGFNSGAASSGTVTSPAITSTVVGGTSPYTYLWSQVSGDTGMSITTPTASSTTVSATVSKFTTPKVGFFFVRVTDAFGVNVYSNECEVSLDWSDTR
jgi:ABC-type antimicrobial peptide transport system permease subunit